MPLNFFPVAAPIFARSHVEDIAGGMADRLVTPETVDAWERWDRCEAATSPAAYRMLFDTLRLSYEAASAGLGLALGFEPIVRPYITGGRLVPCSDRRMSWDVDYQLVTHRSAVGRNDVAAAREWLLAEAAQSEH